MKLLLDNMPSEECRAAMATHGVERYVLVDQNLVPNAKVTGLIEDHRPIVAHARKQLDATPSMTRGVLDFEDPFDQRLSAGPGSALYAQTLDTVLALLETMHQQFPSVKWAYYGWPFVPYWSGSPADETVNRPATARRAEIDSAVSNYAPVLSKCDWTMPTLYLRKSAATVDRAIHEFRYRELRIRAAMACAPGKPCIPAICPTSAPGGERVEHEMLPDVEFTMTQALPALAFQCDGVAIWTAFDYYRKLAIQPTDPVGSRAKIRAAYAKNWGAACLTSDASLATAQGKALASRIAICADVFAHARRRLPGDADGDGTVGTKDLTEVLGHWGERDD